MQTEENMLQAEIEFWRYMIESRRGTVSEQATERMLSACEYMIESRRGTVSEQATERMLNACELAERKLMMIDQPSSLIETRQ